MSVLGGPKPTSENFRSRVGLGAAKSAAGIDDVHFGEPKVTNFDVEFVVDENILQFEISMGDS